MSRFLSAIWRAAGAPIVQDLTAFAALVLFVPVVVYWSAVIAMLLSAPRLAQ